MNISADQALFEISNADLPCFGDKPLTVHTTDVFGSTPLHVAAIWGRIDIADALLRGGAEINKVGEHGFTPLHEAVSQGHKDMVAFLLSRGANPSVNTEFGSTQDLADALENEELKAVLQNTK